MALNTYLSIININVLKVPVKRHGVPHRIFKNNDLYATYKRLILGLKTPADWKWKNGEISIEQMVVKRKP